MNHIKKSTLRHDVSQRIRESILSNELKPGERIIETKIAKELGVSQSPVREAIRELELMGLIENKPYYGCYVKKLSRKDIKDAYKLRACLEMLAANDTAEFITERQLKEMEILLKKMRTAADAGKVNEFVEFDISFHKMIVKISDNALLYKMWEMVNLAQWTFITAMISKRTLHDLADRHEAIFKSLKEHDREGASQCIKIHLEELADEVVSKLEFHDDSVSE